MYGGGDCFGKAQVGWGCKIEVKSALTKQTFLSAVLTAPSQWTPTRVR